MLRRSSMCLLAVLALAQCHVVDDGRGDVLLPDDGLGGRDSGGPPSLLLEPTCGDDHCADCESAWSCPVDCEAVCGDGVCTHTENTDRCPPDCPFVCGNGVCEGEETAPTCPGDCPAWCGVGACTHEESGAICPADCPP